MTDTHKLIWNSDWNLLRAFSVIAEEGNMTRAGERLRLTQPAISNALSRLEDQLGCKLAKRSPRGFTLTAEGEAVARYCRAMLAEASAMASTLADMGSGVRGTIRLAFASRVASPFLDAILADFMRAYPAVVLESKVASSAEVHRLISLREADIGICLAVPRKVGLTTTVLFRETFGFFCAPGHPAFGKSGLSAQDFEWSDHVTFSTERDDGALAEVAAKRTRLNWRGPIIGAYDNVEDVLRMMTLSRAIAPLPIHAVRGEIAAGSLWQVPPFDDLPVVDVLMIANRPAPTERAAGLLYRAISDSIAKTPLSDRTYPLATASAV